MSRLRIVGICALLLGCLGNGRAMAQEEEQPKAEWTAPRVVEHELEGRSACLMCHSEEVKEAPTVPVSHVDRPDETCIWCHAPDADVQTTAPPPIPHALEGRSKCLMCHLSEMMKQVPQVPATHAGRTDGHCALCHVPGETG